MKQRRGRSFRADNTAFLLSGEAESSHSNWAISYGDMVTLLLSFFIMFFGVKENTKFQRFQKALNEKTKALSSGAGTGTATGTAPGVSKPGTGEGQAGGGPLRTGIDKPGPRGGKMDLAWSQLAKLGSARFIKDQQRLVVEFPDVSFFEFNRTELTNAGRAELESFSKLFAPYQTGLRLIVIGYTDNVKVKVSKKKKKVYRYTDNLELSALRGVAAVRHLIDLGVSQERIRVGGEGEWKGKTSYDGVVGDAGQAPVDVAKADSKARKVVLVIEAEEAQK